MVDSCALGKAKATISAGRRSVDPRLDTGPVPQDPPEYRRVEEEGDDRISPPQAQPRGRAWQ